MNLNVQTDKKQVDKSMTRNSETSDGYINIGSAILQKKQINTPLPKTSNPSKRVSINTSNANSKPISPMGNLAKSSNKMKKLVVPVLRNKRKEPQTV